jgi:cytosine deaminase
MKELMPLLNSAIPHYWLTNAHIPAALLVDCPLPTHGEFAAADLEIRAGQITQILPAGSRSPDATPGFDLKRGIVFPCFVDMHTHLDKGHIWGRSPNVDGTFQSALDAVHKDSVQNWNAEDVYRRMEFGLKCSYAHGTQAIRTHIDALGEQAEISFGVFQALRAEWADRLTLQAVSLVPLDYYSTPGGEKLADLVAAAGGILGGVGWMSPELEAQIDRVFALAQERNLNLDFHVDESGNPADIMLRYVADSALRHHFTGQVVCGHCCSLAVQSPPEVSKTLNQVKQAKVGIVSLPMCNLYLQDRNQQSALNQEMHLSEWDAAAAEFPTQTPRWRGVTLAHELKHSGIPIAFASDNCRDPFYGYGDHDGLEVLTQATRAVQLDAPYGDWSRSVTMTPAELMGLPTLGRITVGMSADLVLFKARYFSELFARSQHDRVVLRKGQAIDRTLPDYAELDDLL